MIFGQKDKMIQKIIELYKKSIFEIEDNQIHEINNNINEILYKVKEIISSKESRLLSTVVLYTKEYSKIYNTKKEYKNEIFNELNRTVMSVIEDFHKEITTKLLKNYEEKMNKLYL